MAYDPAEIEDRWRRRWAETGRYEADPGDAGEPTFVTVPYPYPSGGMHVGHARTYTVPDVYARYRRLRGDTVLFPIAWHVTGTPIVGAVERLKRGDEDQIAALQEAFGVPESDLRDLETPMGFARYFIEEADSSYKAGMQQLGLSIDWRREFTTNDDRYSRFIAWQYETLRERGLLEKGLHPVNYCTDEEQPVTTHDLLEGEDAEFQEYTLVRFGMDFRGDRVVVPMATLRPETVRGVTNAFVDPGATYVRATVDGEPWVVSREAGEKFRLQGREVAVDGTFPGADLVGERVENPVTGETVPVLPAAFVDPDDATGVVMSVPAHSPDDYVALQELRADPDRLREHGVDPATVEAVEPVPVLEMEGYGEVPARDAVAAAGVESTGDPALAAVTEDLYREEFHSGRLLADYGEFAGEVVADVRDRFREHHRETGAFGSMYEFSEDVVCRCGGDVEVAVRETWFLRYGDHDWKAKAHRAADRLDAIPENTREQYDHTIDWLEEWPCIRNYGLGTRLPWDPEFVIEPLSDSTIYMAYYTVAHRLGDVPVEDLDRAFFDALFYGPDAAADPDPRALALREEWDYWYPVDWRCSGNDLVSNHLTFYLFHHAELFDEPKWPRGITVMGMGLLEGEAMSSSRGHVVLPGEAVDRYGADTVRFFLLNSAEPWQDYDWRAEDVGAARDALERFWNRAVEVIEGSDATAVPSEGSDTTAVPPPDPTDLARADRWLLSTLQGTVESVTDSLERFETRTASQAAFHELGEHLRWYRRRTDVERPAARATLAHVLATRLRLLAPFVPFLANELHGRLTGAPAEDADWPRPDPDLRDPRVEAEESLVERLVEDVREVLSVTETEPSVVRVYAAADWKRDVYEAVRETEADAGRAMDALTDDPAMRERGDAVADLVADLVEFVRARPEEAVAALSGADEAAVYRDAADFLAREFDADVEVYREGAGDVVDPAGRASGAVPFRPAIHVE